MSTEIISTPLPGDEASHDSGGGAEPRRKDDRRPSVDPIPSREDCLRAIAALPGLVAMRILQPAQANSMRADYEAILRQYDRDRQGQSAQLADEDVLQVWQDQPHLIELLAPVLSQQQLAMIMGKVHDDAGREA